MFEAIGKIGVSGGVGFLAGLIVVWWIEPTTTGGTALLIAVAIIVVMGIGSVISRASKKGDSPVAKDDYGPREDD